MCRKIATVEIACGALVKIKEIIVVDPFEIKQLKDRLAHANVREDRTPCVEHQTLHAFGQAVGEPFFDNSAFAQRRKIVCGLPASGVCFHAQIIKAFFECLEMCVAVAIIVEAYGLEIPQAAVDWQIAPPVIWVALECDRFARPHRADGVGAAAEKRLKAGVFKGRSINRVFCQNRHQANDERQFAIVGAGKVEAHRALADDLRFHNFGVISSVIRPPFVAQQFPGKDDIIRRHHFAIGKPRRLINCKGDKAARCVSRHAFREQSVEGERLVIAARKQALDHITADICCGQTFHNERV